MLSSSSKLGIFIYFAHKPPFSTTINPIKWAVPMQYTHSHFPIYLHIRTYLSFFFLNVQFPRKQNRAHISANLHLNILIYSDILLY